MSDLPAHLTRYQTILDDYEEFAARLDEPLPQTLAINPLRTSVTEIRQLLADSYSLEPVDWRPGALRLHHTDRPGRSWAFAAGLFTLQEEASLLPAWLLDARPGHRVLDLCAAPGNKTTHLALALGNTGTVVANELKRQRLTALHEVCRRLGLVNVSTCAYDGVRLPKLDSGFDRILVDVPCSAEGKAQRGYRRASGPGFRQFIRSQQLGLLRRAIELCNPGGRIVYSTCTFAPEENEAIVSEALAWAGERLRVVAVDCPIAGASPGLGHFDDTRFHPDLQHGIRLWPHRSRTGGFFAVLLERQPVASDSPSDQTAPSTSARPAAASQESGQADAARALTPPSGAREMPEPPPTQVVPLARLAPCLAPFAIPLPNSKRFQLLETQRHLKLICRDHTPPLRLHYENQGLELARLRDDRPRLSSAGAMALGPTAARQWLELDPNKREAWRRRETQALPATQVENLWTGLVLVCHAGKTLGTGVLRKDDAGTWWLASQSPRAWAPPAAEQDKPLT